MPIKPLSFKGDKANKKRKHHTSSDNAPAGNKIAKVDASSDDDSWTGPLSVSELAGPVLIVLPTSPATCLASDPHGNVFASPLVNIVDGNPKTAEPHNVQQVWVVTKVAGLAENEVNFKGSHGGYLSCDPYGVLGARREARGREESFVVTLDEENGKASWQLRTAASKSATKVEDYRYVSATTEGKSRLKAEYDDDDNKGSIPAEPAKVSISIRGDGDASSDTTHMIVRMQSRFRPQSQEVKEAVRAKEKISRRELEAAAGRVLNDEEAKRLKKAKRDGTYHEEILDIRAKGKHDKFA